MQFFLSPYFSCGLDHLSHTPPIFFILLYCLALFFSLLRLCFSANRDLHSLQFRRLAFQYIPYAVHTCRSYMPFILLSLFISPFHLFSSPFHIFISTFPHFQVNLSSILFFTPFEFMHCSLVSRTEISFTQWTSNRLFAPRGFYWDSGALRHIHNPQLLNCTGVSVRTAAFSSLFFICLWSSFTQPNFYTAFNFVRWCSRFVSLSGAIYGSFVWRQPLLVPAFLSSFLLPRLCSLGLLYTVSCFTASHRFLFPCLVSRSFISSLFFFPFISSYSLLSLGLLPLAIVLSLSTSFFSHSVFLVSLFSFSF